MIRTGVVVAAIAVLFLTDGSRAFAETAAAAPATTPATAPSSQPSNAFTIGKDTTRISGPVRPDGTIDYVGALNARMSAGVTPANNAAVGLIRVLGPGAFRIEGAKRAKFFAALGIDPPPADGIYHVVPDQYVEQNAQGDEAQKANDALQHLHDKPWTAAEQPLLAKWVTSQDAAITRIADSVALPKFYLPLVSKSEPQSMFGTVGDGLTAMRSAGRALAYRASFRLGKGDFDGFRSDVRSLSQLSRHLASRPTYLDYLVATGLDALAIATMTGATTSERLTAAQARTLLADLEATPPMPTAAEAIDLGERYIMLDYFVTAARYGWAKAAEMMTGGGRPRPFAYAGTKTRDWDAVFRKVNTWYDRQVAMVAAPSQAERDRAASEFDRELRRLHARSEGPLSFMAPVEDRVLPMIAMPVGAAAKLRTENDLRLELCRVALALAAFHADHSKYPAQAGELVPAYLPVLPPDTLAKGSPDLRYAVNALGGYRLASVGPNGTDDRERAAQNFKVDDIVILGGKQPPPPPMLKEEFEPRLDKVDSPQPQQQPRK